MSVAPTSTGSAAGTAAHKEGGRGVSVAPTSTGSAAGTTAHKEGGRGVSVAPTSMGSAASTTAAVAVQNAIWEPKQVSSRTATADLSGMCEAAVVAAAATTSICDEAAEVAEPSDAAVSGVQGMGIGADESGEILARSLAALTVKEDTTTSAEGTTTSAEGTTTSAEGTAVAGIRGSRVAVAEKAKVTRVGGRALHDMTNAVGVRRERGTLPASTKEERHEWDLTSEHEKGGSGKLMGSLGVSAQQQEELRAAGWVVEWSKREGRDYFFNKKTGVSQWHAPGSRA